MSDDITTNDNEWYAERDERGYFKKRPSGLAKYSFNSVSSKAANQRRWEKYRKAAADRVQKEVGSIVPGITTPFAAWGELNARLAVQIIDSDKPRGDDLRQLGVNMGAIPSASERTTEENSDGTTDAARVLGSLLIEYVRGQTQQLHAGMDAMDGQVTDRIISASNDMRIDADDEA